jgi:hypothetical protein
VSRLDSALRKRGETLLHQQLWCWGCDIRRPAGNLLLEYGFVRSRATDPSVGTTCYRLARTAQSDIGLWLFGMFYGDDHHEGLYISRYGFAPQIVRSARLPDAIWSHRGVPCREPTCDRDWTAAAHLLPAALRWIAGYESWVAATQPPEYRAACIAAWMHEQVPAPDVEHEWLSLALRCEWLLSR